MLYLRVRCLFDWPFWKVCPQVWKGLWITKKTPVQRLSHGVPQGVSEASGYAFYQRVFVSVRFAELWITWWNTISVGGFDGVLL